jgi:branched-chain amino acid transport system substrate-binding protein
LKVPFKSISAGRRRRRLEKGSRRGVMLTGALAASVALLAACGSSSHTSSSATTASAGTASGGTSAGTATGGTTGSAGAAASGTVANGTPITIGVVEPDEGALSLGPAMGPGLNGGFYYVNNVLGGAHGHPIKAITCNTDQTPSIEVNCANNFVSKGVVAVFDDYDAGFAAESPILTRAGIPIFGVEVADQHDDNLPSNYFFGPPNEAFAVGPLQIFHQDGLNKATFTIANVPSGVNYVNDAILPVAKKLGMDVKVTYYDASSVNWQVVANSLLSGSPQVTGMIAAAEGDCTSLLKALRGDGFKGPILMGSCSAYVKADAPDAMDTYSYSAGWLPSLSSAAPAVVQQQITTYNQMMAKTGNANTQALGQWAVNSFSGLVDFRDTLQAGSAPYTPQSIRSDFQKVASYQSFMGPVETCNGQEWPGTSSCNKDLLFVKVISGDAYQAVEPGGFAPLDPSLL